MVWESGEILETLAWIVLAIVVWLLWGLLWKLLIDFFDYVGYHFLKFVTWGRWPKDKENVSGPADFLVGIVGIIVVLFGLPFGLSLLAEVWKCITLLMRGGAICLGDHDQCVASIFGEWGD